MQQRWDAGRLSSGRSRIRKRPCPRARPSTRPTAPAATAPTARETAARRRGLGVPVPDLRRPGSLIDRDRRAAPGASSPAACRAPRCPRSARASTRASDGAVVAWVRALSLGGAGAAGRRRAPPPPGSRRAAGRRAGERAAVAESHRAARRGDRGAPPRRRRRRRHRDRRLHALRAHREAPRRGRSGGGRARRGGVRPRAQRAARAGHGRLARRSRPRWRSCTGTSTPRSAVLDASGGDWARFAQSAGIILREGFEIVLIVGALLAYVRRSGQTALVRPIWIGVGLGVVASIGTAFAARHGLHAQPAAPATRSRAPPCCSPPACCSG